MGIVERYILQLNMQRKRLRRLTAVVTALSLVVVIGVSWSLRLTGITMANDAACGITEHLHGEDCQVERVLICGYPEDPEPEQTVPPTEETTPPEDTTPVETQPSQDTQPTESAEDPTEPPQSSEPDVTEPSATEPSMTEPSETEPAATEPEQTDPPTPEEPSVPTEPEETTPSTTAEEIPEVTENTDPLPDSSQSSSESRHIHTEDCYEIRYLCGLEEHIHELSCYSDQTMDLETSAMWEAGLPQLSGNWAEDIAQIAISQLGNAESERNFQVAADGQTRNGITRYGQWYGNPYGDWSSLFTLFCMNYAEIPEDAIPRSSGVQNMMLLAQERDLLLQPNEAMATRGNILFLDTDFNGNADHSMIVTGLTDETMEGIVGDWENTVTMITLPVVDSGVLGYIRTDAVQTDYSAQPSTEPEETDPEETLPDETVPGETVPDEIQEQEEATPEDPDAPIIDITLEIPEEEGILRLVATTENIADEEFIWQWQVSEDGQEPWTDIDGAECFIYEFADTEENALKYYRLQGRKAPQARTTFALNRAIATTDEDGGTVTSGAVSPFSINKNNNTYTINVYALPVDANGNRISGMSVTNLGTVRLSNNDKVSVTTLFDEDLGQYHSTYFGSETKVTVDNLNTIYRYRSGNTYYLGYTQLNGTTNNTWKNRADNSISLYIRYRPGYTVTFQSEGFDPLTEFVIAGGTPTLTEPETWQRDNHTLAGWVILPDEQTVYTYEQILSLPVNADVTYQAKWWQFVNVRFDLGSYADFLYPIEPQQLPYGGTMDPYPIPTWVNNSAAMAFDGWYTDPELTIPMGDGYIFYTDTTLYAKWSPKDDGYFIYYMDFQRQDGTDLVLMTSSVTEGKTAYPYVPSNPPDGKQWDGKWYLDKECTIQYQFSVPVSDMTGHLTGANSRDLYLYPGTQDACRAIFVTYGTRVDPITVIVGESINLDLYTPERDGYEFAGWTLHDGTPVSGEYTLMETTTFIASWNADYVPFEAILRIENANDTGMTQANILGTWYAKAGSQILVKSTYSGSGTNRTGTHTVVCVINGEEYPVYTNSALNRQATLSDVYATYFIYNNTGTNWTDEVNWDDVYTGGELPYSTRPISSAGDTIINFDYMRVRNDIVFTIPNTNTGGYIDIYKLQQNGLITGSVTYTGTKPTTTGKNVSATGVSAQNISWSYTAASSIGTNQNNYYTLHNMKYGQRIFEVYPVGGSWLTARSQAYHQYRSGSGQLFSSRRQDLTSDFFQGSGRGLKPYSLTVEFEDQEYIALMYAVECLADETPDFTLNGVGYKVDAELCEVVKHTGDFSIKDLDGCEPGISANGTYKSGQNTYNKYYSAKISTNTTSATVMKNAKVGDTSVYTLFAETYWPNYSKFNGVESITTFSRAYIFYYNRLHMNIQFNFGYDSDQDGSNDLLTYEEIPYGERIDEYQFGMPNYQQHQLLERDGYEFSGWLDANGFVLEAEDWESLVATGDSANNTMIFIAKWEKISNNIVEYYEDRSSTEPFETHYFDDGEMVPFPTMVAYPQSWVWQEYGEGDYRRFDWDVPMYGEYGVEEYRIIDGEEQLVNVIRVYGAWDETHTTVIYDPNPAQGGIPGTAPTDPNEYTIWQSEVSVMGQGSTTNMDPDMIFAGWLLDRDGIVYHPGDHVPVRWPRTMIFTAQWVKKDEVIHLRYDPNGGMPTGCYPNDTGFDFKRNATTIVWDNTLDDDTVWFTRTGYTFLGWNTHPDGTGTAYQPNSYIQLTQDVTTLYAQWRRDTHVFTMYKVELLSNRPLGGAEFDLYRFENGQFLLMDTQVSGADGHISFAEIETGTLYKLVEDHPPDGYAIMTKEFYFHLIPDGNTVIFRFCDSEGNALDPPQGVTGEYIAANHHLMFTVMNVAGFKLPATGGIGTPLYILCGMMLVIAPFVYGFRQRRRSERRAAK